MPHHDGLPLVFQFLEEDTQPESQEHKARWDELELALWEDVAPVPTPVPAPVAPTAPAPIPVHLPAHAPARALTRTPVPVPVHLPAHAPACALTCAPVPVPVHTNVSVAPLIAPVLARVPVPPSEAWMAAVNRFLAPTPVASSRQLTCSKVQNILAFLEARPTSRSTPTMAQDASSPSVSGPTTHKARQRSRFPPRDAPAAAA